MQLVHILLPAAGYALESPRWLNSSSSVLASSSSLSSGPHLLQAPRTITQTVTECCSDICSEKTSEIVTSGSLTSFDTTFTKVVGTSTVTVYSPCIKPVSLGASSTQPTVDTAGSSSIFPTSTAVTSQISSSSVTPTAPPIGVSTIASASSKSASSSSVKGSSDNTLRSSTSSPTLLISSERSTLVSVRGSQPGPTRSSSTPIAEPNEFSSTATSHASLFLSSANSSLASSQRPYGTSSVHSSKLSISTANASATFPRASRSIPISVNSSPVTTAVSLPSHSPMVLTLTTDSVLTYTVTECSQKSCTAKPTQSVISHTGPPLVMTMVPSTTTSVIGTVTVTYIVPCPLSSESPTASRSSIADASSPTHASSLLISPPAVATGAVLPTSPRNVTSSAPISAPHATSNTSLPLSAGTSAVAASSSISSSASVSLSTKAHDLLSTPMGGVSSFSSSSSVPISSSATETHASQAAAVPPSANSSSSPSETEATSTSTSATHLQSFSHAPVVLTLTAESTYSHTITVCSNKSCSTTPATSVIVPTGSSQVITLLPSTSVGVVGTMTVTYIAPCPTPSMPDHPKPTPVLSSVNVADSTLPNTSSPPVASASLSSSPKHVVVTSAPTTFSKLSDSTTAAVAISQKFIGHGASSASLSSAGNFVTKEPTELSPTTSIRATLTLSAPTTYYHTITECSHNTCKAKPTHSIITPTGSSQVITLAPSTSTAIIGTDTITYIVPCPVLSTSASLVSDVFPSPVKSITPATPPPSEISKSALLVPTSYVTATQKSTAQPLFSLSVPSNPVGPIKSSRVPAYSNPAVLTLSGPTTYTHTVTECSRGTCTAKQSFSVLTPTGSSQVITFAPSTSVTIAGTDTVTYVVPCPVTSDSPASASVSVSTESQPLPGGPTSTRPHLSPVPPVATLPAALSPAPSSRSISLPAVSLSVPPQVPAPAYSNIPAPLDSSIFSASPSLSTKSELKTSSSLFAGSASFATDSPALPQSSKSRCTHGYHESSPSCGIESNGPIPVIANSAPRAMISLSALAVAVLLF